MIRQERSHSTSAVMSLIVALVIGGCADPVSSLPRDLMTPGTVLAMTAEAGPHVLRQLPRPVASTNSAAFGMNDFGVAVGYSDYTYSGPLVAPEEQPCKVYAGAMIFRAGEVYRLHERIMEDLGGLNPCRAFTFATDINNDGTVVGVMTTTQFDVNRGFVWSEKTGTILTGENDYAMMARINNRGVAIGWYAGYYSTLGGVTFLWSREKGTYEAPGPPVELYNWYYGYDVNDYNGIVGRVDSDLGRWNAPGWGLYPAAILEKSAPCGPPIGISDLQFWFEPFLGEGGINNHGVAAYGGCRSGVRVPLVTAKDGVTGVPVGWSNGWAGDISDAGRVIGRAWEPTVQRYRAMTRGPREAPHQLPLPAWGRASHALDVNRCGSVAGWITTGEGRRRAVVWQIGACDVN